MKKWLILCCFFFITALVLSACNLPGYGSAKPTLDIFAVQRAEQTIVAQFTQTALSIPVTGETVVVQPSETPQPVSTQEPLPTFTPTLSPQPTASVPEVSVSVDTNCRSGPHIVYDYQGAVLVGETTQILGKHPEKNWLLVKNPDREGQSCWMTMQYAQVNGDLTQVPIVTPPPFYDWNGIWTYTEFQGAYNGSFTFVQNGRNLSGVMDYPSGFKTIIEGTLQKNGQEFHGTVTVNLDPPFSYPIYFKMLANMKQFIASANSAEDYTVLHACGYRDGAGYPSGCPTPTP